MKSVALLRGINVGGKNIVPMKELAALFAKAGCSDVATYIQSGNVVYSAAPKLDVPEVLAKAIAKKFGFQVPVIVRTHDELKAIAGRNPYPKAEIERLLVMFLSDKPGAAAVKQLDPNRSPPDEFRVNGGEIYLHCPNGFGRSKLSNAWFDSKLSTVSTGRNWKTLLKLLELTK